MGDDEQQQQQQVPPAVEVQVDDDEQPTETAAVTTEEKPRQWLYDRSNGQSKIDPDLRPLCSLCWPPPCVKILPDCMEQNSCCETMGNIGYFPEDDPCSRIWLMRKSMLIHFIGLILSVLSCAALTHNPDLLEHFSFSSGVVTGEVAGVEIQQVNIEVGLQGVYTKDAFFGERTFDFDEVCVGGTVGIPLTPQEECNTCSEASSGLIATMILGVVTYIPTIASNVNRSYYNYDVNCQKVFGTIIALFNMIMSLYTWQGYANDCFANFFDGDVTIPVLIPSNATEELSDQARMDNYVQVSEFFSQYTADELSTLSAEDLYGNQTDWADEYDLVIANVNFNWHMGTGLILVVTATLLKIFDIINHFLIRTPSITRSLQEQLEYEKLHGGEDNNADDEREGDNEDAGAEEEDDNNDKEASAENDNNKVEDTAAAEAPAQ